MLKPERLKAETPKRGFQNLRRASGLTEKPHAGCAPVVVEYAKSEPVAAPPAIRRAMQRELI